MHASDTQGTREGHAGDPQIKHGGLAEDTRTCVKVSLDGTVHAP